jgi:hypothetical protein
MPTTKTYALTLTRDVMLVSLLVFGVFYGVLIGSSYLDVGKPPQTHAEGVKGSAATPSTQAALETSSWIAVDLVTCENEDGSWSEDDSFFLPCVWDSESDGNGESGLAADERYLVYLHGSGEAEYGVVSCKEDGSENDTVKWSCEIRKV